MVISDAVGTLKEITSYEGHKISEFLSTASIAAMLGLKYFLLQLSKKMCTDYKQRSEFKRPPPFEFSINKLPSDASNSNPIKSN